MLHLIEELREHLVTLGLVRKPGSADDGTPVCWIMPENGLPAPGQAAGDNASQIVVGLYTAPGIPGSAFEGFIAREAIDLWIRSAPDDLPASLELQRELRLALHDRRGWLMNDLKVQVSTESRPYSLIEAEPEHGHTFVGGVAFTLVENDRA